MPPTRRLLAFIGIGLVVGFMSGLFGVGGGVLIVPALVLLLRFEQKVATGTSLLAVAPIAVVGTIAYGVEGHIDWTVSLFLAIGMVVGGVLGSWLLVRIRTVVLAWAFVAVLIATAVRMFLADPARGTVHVVDAAEVVVLIAIGVLVGVLSGLLGVGGGIVIVPTLVVLFGLDDLFAKGASLVALLPNSVIASILNLRRRNGDLAAAIAIGLAGAATAWPGMLLAEFLEPRIASMLFGAFLLAIAAQLAVRTWRRSQRRPGAAG